MDSKGIAAFAITVIALLINIISVATDYWVEDRVRTPLFSRNEMFHEKAFHLKFYIMTN